MPDPRFTLGLCRGPGSMRSGGRRKEFDGAAMVSEPAPG